MIQNFGNKKMWWRGFHATTIEAAKGIQSTEFHPSRQGKIGPGIYLSPHIEYALHGYSKTVKCTEAGVEREYAVVLQCAVRPQTTFFEKEQDKATAEKPFGTGYCNTRSCNTGLHGEGKRYHGEDCEWVVWKAADVRAYGILLLDVTVQGEGKSTFHDSD